MTSTADQDGHDQAPDADELSLISTLSVGVPGTVTLTGQGDAPGDLSERQAPHVPVPSRGGLGAAEVARLTSQDESVTDANNALDRAEGVVTDDED